MTILERLGLRKEPSFFAAVLRVFMPPFEGLPLVLWCYFVLSYIALPQNPMWRGDLPDPDDYTYLSQTLDWLQGQGWFDNTQYRMSPPSGVAIHYTRFAEIPIAAALLLFRAFHYSWRGAALLASFVVPVFYLGAFFAALRWTAAKLITPDWARLTSFVVLFGSTLMFKFAPGQVDHHGLEAILTIIGFGFAAQMFRYPDELRHAVGCGAVLALATAVALEVLPWMALTSFVLGLWTVIKGRKTARAVEAYSLSLFLTSLLLLVLEKAPADILRPDLLAYSVAYVVLMGAIACTLILASKLSAVQNKKVRLSLAALAAFALGGLYLWRFPDLLAGPYGAMDKRLATLFFTNLEEAVPLTERYDFFKSLLLLATPLLGFVSGVFFFRKAKDARKWSWFLLTSLLGAAIALAVFYQIRVLIYALLFAVIPLVACVEYGWLSIGKHCRGRRRFWAEILLVLCVGPLTAVLLPALQDGRSFNVGVLLFPAQSFDDSCQMRGLETVLNAPPYAGRVLNIVNMLDQGPELLFRTSHRVLSAPYHTNVAGNLDALDFFSGTDRAQAQEIVKRDDINLVVLCRNIPDMYFHEQGPHYAVLPDGAVKMRPDPSLAGQLMMHKIPDWLNEISVPGSNYLMFEVK